MKKSFIIGIAILAVGILISLILIFDWKVLSPVNYAMFSMIFPFIIIIVFIIMVIISIVGIFQQWKAEKLYSFLPLLITVFTLWLWLFATPKLVDCYQDYLFNANFKQYSEVVTMAMNGKFTNSESGSYKLDKKYSHLSTGGEIRVEREGKELNVTFYYVQDFNIASGIVYTSSNKVFGDSRYFKAEKKRNNWYYVAWD